MCQIGKRLLITSNVWILNHNLKGCLNHSPLLKTQRTVVILLMIPNDPLQSGEQ
jgi:hypothetical protein